MKYIILKIILFSLFFISEAKSDVPGISIPYYKTSALTEFENHDWTDRTIPSGMTPEELHELDVKFRNLPESLRKPAGIAETYSVGDTETYWIETSASDNQWRQITAECRKVTSEAYVFVALADIDDNPVYYDGSNEGYITQDDADSIVEEFSDIYTTDRSVFGNEPEKGINGDSHVTILLLDIDDSYAGGYSGGNYIGGYFYGIDTFNESLAQQNGYHSNECKIIYIDTYPGIENSPKPDTEHDVRNVYRVLAHEFQHLIHFYYNSGEELWVDEGCASLAEYVCGYDLRTPDNFSAATDNPLTNWGSENILIDYEQVALFFLYLYEHYGGVNTIKAIVSNTSTSKDGINAVLASRGYTERFYNIFDDWCIANYLDDTSIYDSRYGYQGIDLSNYPFTTANTHSYYHVSGSGNVSKNAVDYIRFIYGIPLMLYYTSDNELDGYVIAKGSASTTITSISESGSNFMDFGTTTSELILVAPAHESSDSYSYFTTDTDIFEPNNSRETAYNISFINNTWNSDEANIASDSDEDWFKFSGNEGDYVTIVCNVTSDLDAEIVLYKDDIKLIYSNSGINGDDETIADYTLHEDGNYYIGVGNQSHISKTAKTNYYSDSYDLIVTIKPSTTLKWKYYTGGSVYSSPALFKDCTMVGVWSSEGLYVLDSNGTLQWKYAIPSVYSSPCVNIYGTIYIGSPDGCLYSIKSDGTFLWNYQTSDEIYSIPALNIDGTVYSGSLNSYIYAINPNGSLIWKYKTEGRIHSSSPSIGSDGTIYIGSEDNYLYALNPDGTLKWKYKTGGIICSSPAIGEDGTIYFGSWDGYLYAIHQNGSLKWKYQAYSSIFSSPAISSSGIIYFGSTIGKSLYAVNTEGNLEWKFETDDYIYSSTAVGVDGTVYVGSHDNYIYAVNSDGTLQWKYKTGDKIDSSPVISSDGTVYIGSNDGYLYALESSSMGLDNGPWPMRGHDERHTGRFGGGEEINNPPTFVITTLPDATQDELYSVATTVEDPDLNKGDSLTFEILEVPEWLAINDYGVLTGTPTNNDVGTDIPLLIRVVDSVGLANTLSTVINVININDPPVIEKTILSNAMENSSYVDTLFVNDPDISDILKFDILEGPEWLAIETIEDSLGVLTGTPTNNDVGTDIPLLIRVVDSGGLADTLSTSISVINVNNPPKFLTTELANATQNVSYTDTLVVEDQDADDILKFDILEGPEWLAIETIEDSLGVLKGTPSNDDVGTGVIITIKVEDTGGLSDTLSTVLNVINILEPPYGLQVSDIPDDNGHSLMLIWSLSPDDDVISHYAVYRSRNPELTEAVPLEFFDSLEDLKAAEQEQTILIDTVNAGESAYTDTFVPVNGVTYYYWVATVSESGQTSKLTPLDNDPVKVSVYSVPGRFSLTGNFPNPFNASTSIQFEIPVRCHVKLDVFSVSGQHVATLMDNPVSPGIHSFVWEPGNIAAGIYLYSLKAGGKQFVGKMVFLK